MILQDELEVQKSSNERVTADYHRSQQNIVSMNQSILDKEVLAKVEHEKLLAAKSEWDAQQNLKQTAEEAAKAAEVAFEKQKVALRAIEREQDVLKDSMFKHSQELFKQRKEESNYVSVVYFYSKYYYIALDFWNTSYLA